MQKNNKYLVWTIWVATITFIGAGFVGWGTYQFGSKASSVAKVGEVEISRARLNMVYGNLYARYNQMFQGKFDEEKAKQFGLTKQAFAQLQTQAYLLNLAKEIGITATDEEVAKKLISFAQFQTDGKFDKSIYERYLKSIRMNTKEYESMLKDELIIEKVLEAFEVEPYPFEVEVIASVLTLSDKLSYRVLSLEDVAVSSDEKDLKEYWQKNQSKYLLPKRYALSILWIGTDDANVTQEEVKRYYDENSFRYADANGKLLAYEDVKDLVESDLKVKKSKKKAQKAYIAFKKGKLKASEKVTLPINDAKLSRELWDSIKTSSPGDILKPKVVGMYYAVVKIEHIEEPKQMTFEQAKERARADFERIAKLDALSDLAKKVLKEPSKYHFTQSDYVNLQTSSELSPLDRQETSVFLQKLFTSKEEKGIINLSNKSVVYIVEDQKVSTDDTNASKHALNVAEQLKQNVFRGNLIEYLRSKYPTTLYVEGL